MKFTTMMMPAQAQLFGCISAAEVAAGHGLSLEVSRSRRTAGADVDDGHARRVDERSEGSPRAARLLPPPRCGSGRRCPCPVVAADSLERFRGDGFDVILDIILCPAAADDELEALAEDTRMMRTTFGSSCRAAAKKHSPTFDFRRSQRLPVASTPRPRFARVAPRPRQHDHAARVADEP